MSASSSGSTPGIAFCTTRNKDGTTCTCRQYQDPEIITPGQPTLCRECAHGRSNHDGVPGKKQAQDHAWSVDGILGKLNVDIPGIVAARQETLTEFRKAKNRGVGKNAGGSKLNGVRTFLERSFSIHLLTFAHKENRCNTHRVSHGRCEEREAQGEIP